MCFVKQDHLQVLLEVTKSLAETDKVAMCFVKQDPLQVKIRHFVTIYF